MGTHSSSPVLLTARQVATMLQVSAKTIYRLAALGRIPAERASRSLREAIEQWLGQAAHRRSLRRLSPPGPSQPARP
ncbi:MAG: helix-turn-helix domain-containing protein [Bryobacteraceae bacterium]